MSIVNTFSLQSNRQIKINFDGGDLSSDAGLLLIKEFISKLGIERLLNRSFKTNDSAVFRYHTDRDNLLQMIYMIMAGYFEDDASDELTKDPEGDFDEIAKSVDDSYSSLEGTFDANDTSDDEDSENEDSEEDSSTSSSTYPDEVIKVLRTLDDGEVAPDVIETDTAYYVVKLNQKNDEEATETKKESIISTREQDLYTETTDKWMEDADIKEEKKVLKTLKVTDNHKYNQPTATPEPTEEAADTTEDTEVTETPEADATETPEVTEAASATTTPEATEAASATTTPEATEAPSYSTDTSLTVKDGDTVNIDYVGKIDGTAFDRGSTDGKGTDLVIGSGSYIDNFEDQLVGAHPGDEVEVTVTFPDDYGVDELNGKEAVFDVTVNGIYE